MKSNFEQASCHWVKLRLLVWRLLVSSSSSREFFVKNVELNSSILSGGI